MPFQKCLQVLVLFPEDQKTAADKEAEQKLMEELVEVVEQRDALVSMLEEDRLKYGFNIS